MREVSGCKKSCPEHLVPVSYFESYWEGGKDSVLIMQDIFTALCLWVRRTGTDVSERADWSSI